MNEIGIAAFRYSAGDLSRVRQDGIPRVRLNSRLRFLERRRLRRHLAHDHHLQAALYRATWHSYPLADDDSRVDSLELGFGLANFWPVPNKIDYALTPARERMSPGRTYTYFCRIHPFMRVRSRS